jgi:bifunctional non-homologous end joining protein LigD
MATAENTLEVDGKELKISNIAKVLYPSGFTKGQVLEYYAKIAPVMVPHIAGRGVTLKRYPEGTTGPFFYEKQCPPYHPKWLKTASVPRVSRPGTLSFCTIDDAASLLWIANLASLEIHILLSKAKDFNQPTAMAFDLDPGPGATLVDCAWAALELRRLFETLRLKAFPKTSGKKGIHLYVPLNTPVTFDESKEFAHGVALAMEKEFPDRIVSKMAKELRPGKVLVDWSQNDTHKTTVAAYSLRAADDPTVSTPITWQELETFYKRKKPSALRFLTKDVLARVEKHGDLFEPVLLLKQKLPKTKQTLAAATAEPAKPAKPNRPFKSRPSPEKTSPLAQKNLSKYRTMRDFGVTPEPKGGLPSAKGKEIFVIQKHAASHLHYDFRLEADGVLKSWAVPKGPSTQLGTKRLAMQTEDHPMNYAAFEGTIPEGEYGGGTVMVWDTGTYVNLTSHKGKRLSLSAGIARGHIDFWLQGKKLNGGWSLIRTGQTPRHWLLVKMDDPGVNYPPDPVAEQPDSVQTGRSLDDIAEDKKSKVWHSNR